jgi:diacylglycerol kinase
VISFLKSFGFALKGIATAIDGHRNIKVQLGVALLVVIASWYFQISSVEWCIILLVITVVISLEMMNTALEHAVNLVTKEYHPLAGKAKDVAAGAVLIASIMSVIIGLIIFLKYFLAL